MEPVYTGTTELGNRSVTPSGTLSVMALSSLLMWFRGFRRGMLGFRGEAERLSKGGGPPGLLIAEDQRSIFSPLERSVVKGKCEVESSARELV